MAHIANFGFLARLRSDATHHVIRYANGRAKRSGRGLSFWFLPQTASLAELPMDDREMTLFVKGRSRDFQALSLQGALTWRVADPERLAARVDFTILLDSGEHRSEPLEQIQRASPASPIRRRCNISPTRRSTSCSAQGWSPCASS